LIELTTGLLFVAAFLEFGITQTTVKWLFFTCLILILTVTDLRVRLLPDVVNWPGFAAGLMFSAFVPPNNGFAGILAGRFLQVRLPGFAAGILDGILGAAFGSFLLWGMAAGYRLVRGHEGMGMGDVKMIAMIGAFLGLRLSLLTLMLASLLGAVIGLIYVFATRKDSSTYELPFGSFIGLAALIVGLFGQVIVVWYSHLGA
jgi:leader peptidase (prepilin peptidase) / N-methyltransferase